MEFILDSIIDSSTMDKPVFSIVKGCDNLCQSGTLQVKIPSNHI